MTWWHDLTRYDDVWRYDDRRYDDAINDTTRTNSMTVQREAGTTTTHSTVWWYNVTMRRRTVWGCNWCYDKMLQRTYGGTMGNNVTDDMMTHSTKRLTINDGGTGSKLEFYLSNSILLVVRDSTLDCHAILDHMQCCRDCMQSHAMSQRSYAMAWDVAAIACDCMRCHAILKKIFLSLTVWVLENTPGTRSGTESLPEEFLHDNCEQIYYHYFFRLSQKRRNEKRDSFYTANVFLPVCIKNWFTILSITSAIHDGLQLFKAPIRCSPVSTPIPQIYFLLETFEVGREILQWICT